MKAPSRNCRDLAKADLFTLRALPAPRRRRLRHMWGRDEGAASAATLVAQEQNVFAEIRARREYPFRPTLLARVGYRHAAAFSSLLLRRIGMDAGRGARYA